VVKTLPFPGTERFLVKRCLGAGGFGTVYEALDRKRSAVVALKVLREASADDLYRFKQEFRSLSGNTHRNLVTLYELFSEENQWFFSMEFVQGRDFISHHRSSGAAGSGPGALSYLESSGRLAPNSPTVVSADGLPLFGRGSFDRARVGDDAAPLPTEERAAPLPARRPVSAAQLLRSLRQLAEGLLFLHDQGLVHRDIKPAENRECRDRLKTGACRAQSKGRSKIFLQPAAWSSPPQGAHGWLAAGAARRPMRRPSCLASARKKGATGSVAIMPRICPSEARSSRK